MQPVFITGIGTDVGKTVVSAIVAEALEADYWKPVQAGFDDGTDTQRVGALLTNSRSSKAAESYMLKMPASPHRAASDENVEISLDKIMEDFRALDKSRQLIIEGAGGLLVPLNDREKIADLVKALDAKVILVSRNYLGSINHSLLTAAFCKQQQLDVAGWIFNGVPLEYSNEITHWSGYAAIGNIPQVELVDQEFVSRQAVMIRNRLKEVIC